MSSLPPVRRTTISVDGLLDTSIFFNSTGVHILKFIPRVTCLLLNFGAANGILKFHHSFPGREERTSRLFKDAELDGKLEIRDES